MFSAVQDTWQSSFMSRLHDKKNHTQFSAEVRLLPVFFFSEKELYKEPWMGFDIIAFKFECH